MFFYLSKILDFLIQPIVWILILLVLGFCWRRTELRKYFFVAAFSVLLIFTNPFLMNEAWLAWEKPPVSLKGLPQYDAGIVLTGVTTGTKSPHDRVYFKKGADRLMHALLLYKRGHIKKFVITGGSGAINQRYATEADELRKILLMAAVPDSVILIENKSRNTHENATFTAELLKKHPELKNNVLITSAFHMRRAQACFQKAGLNPAIFPADFYSSDRYFTPDELLIPQEQALTEWSVLLHEMVGFFIYKLMGYC
jgi:uncharacterized SAM-binding protein YcdF (DUF218 family)